MNHPHYQVYLAYIVNLYRRNAVYSSGPIFLFTLLYMLYSIVTFRSMLLKLFSDVSSLVKTLKKIFIFFNTKTSLFLLQSSYYPEFSTLYFVSRVVSFVFSIGLFLICCFNEYTPDKKLDPHQTSGFLSRITFWWFTPMILKGYRRPLTENDMYRMNLVNTSKEVLNNFEQKLDTIRTEKIIKKMKTEAYSGYQHSEAEKRSVQINVAIVIIKVYWMQLLGIAMLKFVASCLTFGNPVILDFLMTFMSDTSGSQPTWRGFLFAAMMFVFPLFESVINSQHDYWMNILILRIRTCMISMIYNKSLRLSTYGRRNYSTGEIVNIMSVDSQRLTDFLLWANSIWAAPLQFGIAIYLLWQQVGWASMAGLIFMFILLPFNGWISARIRNNQMKVMKEKDKRTKLMNEILNGMKVLKLYAWENSFKDKIQSLRDYECKELYNIAYLSGFMFFAFSAAPFLVSFLFGLPTFFPSLKPFSNYIIFFYQVGLLTFALYVLSGNVLDPNKAFVSLSLFNIIRVPMGMLPMLLSMGAMVRALDKKSETFLNLINKCCPLFVVEHSV